MSWFFGQPTSVAAAAVPPTTSDESNDEVVFIEIPEERREITLGPQKSNQRRKKHRMTVFCDLCNGKRATSELNTCTGCRKVYCDQHEEITNLKCYHCLKIGCTSCNTNWCTTQILTNVSTNHTATFCNVSCAKAELKRCQRLQHTVKKLF